MITIGPSALHVHPSTYRLDARVHKLHTWRVNRAGGFMAQCAYCGTETELYDGPSPVCLACVKLSPTKRETRAKLVHSLHEATMRTEAATEAFTAVTGDIPSGLPQPDGVQRIHNASRNLSVARDEMMKAHKRLNDFLQHGTVPDDLKRSD